MKLECQKIEENEKYKNEKKPKQIKHGREPEGFLGSVLHHQQDERGTLPVQCC